VKIADDCDFMGDSNEDEEETNNNNNTSNHNNSDSSNDKNDNSNKGISLADSSQTQRQTPIYYLITAYIGEISKKEPSDRSIDLNSKEGEQSLSFWSQHAFIYDRSMMGPVLETTWQDVVQMSRGGRPANKPNRKNRKRKRTLAQKREEKRAKKKALELQQQQQQPCTDRKGKREEIDSSKISDDDSDDEEINSEDDEQEKERQSIATASSDLSATNKKSKAALRGRSDDRPAVLTPQHMMKHLHRLILLLTHPKGWEYSLAEDLYSRFAEYPIELYVDQGMYDVIICVIPLSRDVGGDSKAEVEKKRNLFRRIYYLESCLSVRVCVDILFHHDSDPEASEKKTINTDELLRDAEYVTDERWRLASELWKQLHDMSLRAEETSIDAGSSTTLVNNVQFGVDIKDSRTTESGKKKSALVDMLMKRFGSNGWVSLRGKSDMLIVANTRWKPYREKTKCGANNNYSIMFSIELNTRFQQIPSEDIPLAQLVSNNEAEAFYLLNQYRTTSYHLASLASRHLQAKRPSMANNEQNTASRDLRVLNAFCCATYRLKDSDKIRPYHSISLTEVIKASYATNIPGSLFFGHSLELLAGDSETYIDALPEDKRASYLRWPNSWPSGCIPLENESVDVVIATMPTKREKVFFENNNMLRRAIAEFNRVLKSGRGVLVLISEERRTIFQEIAKNSSFRQRKAHKANIELNGRISTWNTVFMITKRSSNSSTPTSTPSSFPSSSITNTSSL